MKGLLFKEYYANRKMLFVLSFMFLWAFAISIVSHMPAFGTLLLLLLTGTMNTEIFKQDEISSWHSFVSSVPASLEGQVRVKYLAVFILNLLALFESFIASVTEMMISGKADMSDYTLCFLLFVVFLFINALELPFYVRFGSKKGLAIKGALYGIGFIIIIIYFLFGDISLFSNENFIFKIIGFLTGDKSIIALSTASIIAALSYLFSCRLSIKICKEGGNNDE